MASILSCRFSFFFQQGHNHVIADDVADTLLHELHNKLKAIYDPDSSISTSLHNPETTPDQALDRWYLDHCIFMRVEGVRLFWSGNAPRL